MIMKRGIILSLCAVALLAFAGTAAFATTDVALELTYTHPADPSQGGTWELVAKTDTAGGLSGLSAVIDNVDLTGIAIGGPNQAILCDGSPCAAINGSVVNVVYGQDLTAIVNGIGTAADGNNRAQDPLDPQNVGAGTWDDVVVLASGAFSTGARPEFDPAVNPWIDNSAANAFDGSDVPQVDAIGLLNVRGDSLESLGLETPGGSGLIAGDGNRNGTISFFSDLLGPFNNIGPATGQGWADGDFNGNGVVSFFSDLLGPFNNIGGGGTPPAVSAVPEPGSMALLLMAAAGMIGIRNRVK